MDNIKVRGLVYNIHCLFSYVLYSEFMSPVDSYATAIAQVTGSKLIIGRDREFNALEVETMRIGPRESMEEK